MACRKVFAEQDCSIRVKEAIAHKAAPVAMDYAVVDLISFRRKQEDENPDRKWSTATRNIGGFDGEKIAWGLCEGGPVAIATDKIRPSTPNET
eukprot:9229958-Karenia_brevis.AAC.1